MTKPHSQTTPWAPDSKTRRRLNASQMEIATTSTQTPWAVSPASLAPWLEPGASTGRIAVAASDRTCGTCNACCIVPEIRSLNKPELQACGHLCRTGCATYQDRPPVCVAFHCAWLSGAISDSALRPDKCGVLVSLKGWDPHLGLRWAQVRLDGRLDRLQKSQAQAITVALLLRGFVVEFDMGPESEKDRRYLRVGRPFDVARVKELLLISEEV